MCEVLIPVLFEESAGHVIDDKAIAWYASVDKRFFTKSVHLTRIINCWGGALSIHPFAINVHLHTLTMLWLVNKKKCNEQSPKIVER